MKPLLAAAAVLVALTVAAASGGVFSATGEEPRSLLGQVQVAGTDEESQKANPAAREFVGAKKAWTACAKAAPADERACGRKPHPHDPAFGKHVGHGPPPWAGGPDRRTAEPPGHSKRD